MDAGLPSLVRGVDFDVVNDEVLRQLDNFDVAAMRGVACPWWLARQACSRLARQRRWHGECGGAGCQRGQLERRGHCCAGFYGRYRGARRSAAARARGFDDPFLVTGMMVTARVADSGLAPRRSPFQRAAGEEKFGPESRFTAILSGI